MGNCLQRPRHTPSRAESNRRLRKEDVVHLHIPHEMENHDLEGRETSHSEPHVIHVQIGTAGIRDVEQAYIKLYKCISEIVDEGSPQPAVLTPRDRREKSTCCCISH